MSKIVYIACPYTLGDVAVNIHNAIKAADKVAEAGMVPFIPILTHFWHLVSPHPIDFWYKNDLEILKRFDALLRLPGKSHGADTEMEEAIREGIPVFLDIESLERWYKEIGTSVPADGNNTR